MLRLGLQRNKDLYLTTATSLLQGAGTFMKFEKVVRIRIHPLFSLWVRIKIPITRTLVLNLDVRETQRECGVSLII